MIKKYVFYLIFTGGLLLSLSAGAQQITGKVVEQGTRHPVPNVHVSFSSNSLKTTTNLSGEFSFSEEIPKGETVLILFKNGFLEKRFLLNVASENIDLDEILLQPDIAERDQISAIISLTDQELDEESRATGNISGLLQASRDVFLNAAAFDFSPTFFRPRGYDSEWGVVLINGIKMNKIFNGRPLWSNWGGLNDVQRNQVFSPFSGASEVSFGAPAGTTNIVMRASQYTHGAKFSYAVANRSYSGRAMGSYHSGLLPSGWAYSVSIARRFAEESYIDGSSYDANSIFASVEKKINERHSLNFTGMYTPNRRGKNSPNTREVFDLKGRKYNSYWGFDAGEIRNARIKTVEEPILMLNHFWEVNRALQINSNLAVQFGKSGNSRIDYGGSRILNTGGETIFVGGGSNPDPAYYQKMPSYFLRFQDDPDYRAAYLAQEAFQQEGQINWEDLYLANQTSQAAGGNALYALYDDRTDDFSITANSIFRYTHNPFLVFTGKIAYHRLKSDNFAAVLDLFGADVFLDIDSFSEGDAAQNNLLNPNNLVAENDIFKYHYELVASTGNTFLQAEWNRGRVEAFAAIALSYTNYQRRGIFKNGNFPENSLGGSRQLEFGNYAAKTGILYKITGRHLLNLNVAYSTEPPSLRNSFINARQNNETLKNLTNQTVLTGDFGYIIRSPFATGRITGFYGNFAEAADLSFYYASGLAGAGREGVNAFVQEALTGIEKRHFGVEFGLEVPITTTLKIKSAGSFGKYTYTSNPFLTLTSDDFPEVREVGTADINGYRVPGGPQQAAQLGVEYRDPNYWWLSLSANYFAKAFIDIAPLTRTQNFYTDIDGKPLLKYDPEAAKALLQQEEFPQYTLFNLVGGKSWRLKNKYIGIFFSLNNLLNTSYITGGYEQSRNVNYSRLEEDVARERPLFGSKYWMGLGTSYYAHVYLRF